MLTSYGEGRFVKHNIYKNDIFWADDFCLTGAAASGGAVTASLRQNADGTWSSAEAVRQFETYLPLLANVKCKIGSLCPNFSFYIFNFTFSTSDEGDWATGGSVNL